MEQNKLFQIADDILKQIDIVEIISHYVKLQKRGRNYTCLCPFHDDKKLGNFYVTQEKQFFKCFSCGTSGNAINFVQKMENITYVEAIKKVCEIAGIHDSRLENKTKSSISPVLEETYKCLTEISDYYKICLTSAPEGKDGLEYLYNRGLSDDVISYFNIGYSLNDGTKLINYLQSVKGFSIKTISNTGICNATDNPIKDINASRIIFPITNRNGQVVGFSARVFKGKSDAKYVNTRETIAFNKSTILYNFHNAINEAKKVGFIYVLEGFMDVIACYRVGIKAAVALMGTALTKEHIKLLRYLNVEIRLCLDLDAPGQNAMSSIINEFDKEGLKYKLVNNLTGYEGKDSDEILAKNGGEALLTFLSNLISKGEWLLNHYSKSLNLDSLDDRKKLINSFLPVLANLKDTLELEDYVTRLSKLSKFSVQNIKSVLKNYKTNHKILDDDQVLAFYNTNRFDKRDLNRLEIAERYLMQYILENKEALDLYNLKLGFMSDETYGKIINCIEDFLIDNNNSDYSVDKLISYLSTQEDSKISDKNKLINELTSLSLEEKYKPSPYSKDSAIEIISTINQERENFRNKQALEDGMRGKSDLEKAEFVQNYLNKKKKQINNLNKKEGGK